MSSYLVVYVADESDQFDSFPGRALRKGESAWDVERDTRDFMSNLIRETISTFPSHTQTLVIMSDVDEIPSKSTIALLRACDFGRQIHLQLRNYLYR